MTKNNIFS